MAHGELLLKFSSPRSCLVNVSCIDCNAKTSKSLVHDGRHVQIQPPADSAGGRIVQRHPQLQHASKIPAALYILQNGTPPVRELAERCAARRGGAERFAAGGGPVLVRCVVELFIPVGRGSLIILSDVCRRMVAACCSARTLRTQASLETRLNQVIGLLQLRTPNQIKIAGSGSMMDLFL